MGKSSSNGRERRCSLARRILWALCAGPAVAATLITGSSAASAAVLTSVPGGIVNDGPHGPGHPNCSKWQLERWNLNGSDTITAVYHGANFNYTVTFKQNGSCLTGTLTDSYIPAPGPQSGPISGTIRGNTVTFSFTYPTNVQGKAPTPARSAGGAPCPAAGARRVRRCRTTGPGRSGARRTTPARASGGGTRGTSASSAVISHPDTLRYTRTRAGRPPRRPRHPSAQEAAATAIMAA
jgi:hypothetical protein